LSNVLKGEMSLVGPRPIVEEEIKMYREGYRLYRQVRPGITGLWQVSGRNDVGYEQRVRFDEYYARNWSIWLDIYILIRTIGAVLRQDGAY
jgi:lipopolysaccharide/colanic/teichoic acid biosynthesis glycosyltransferase